MYDSFLLFSSYTAAMNAVNILSSSGVRSVLKKKIIPGEGCTYVLSVSDRKRAEELLDSSGICFSECAGK